MRITGFLSTFFALALAATPALGSYSAVGDFPATPLTSAGQATGSIWSYGTYGTDSPVVSPGTFTALNSFTNLFLGGSGSNSAFYSPTVGSDGSFNLPAVAKNTSAGDINSGTINNWANNLLLLHPGANGEYAVVRFAAPTTATYTINGEFVGLDNRNTTTDIHVLDGNTSLLSSLINTSYVAQTFAFTENLTAGQTVDFAVGFGSNGNLLDDATGFNATITDITPNTTTTPEPAMYGAMALGLSALYLKRRRA